MKRLKLTMKRKSDGIRITVLSEPAHNAGSRAEGLTYRLPPDSTRSIELLSSASLGKNRNVLHPSGQGVHSFLSRATTKRYQQDSEWKEKTQRHDCVVYSGYAPFAASLRKGTHLVVEGEPTYREYSRTIEIQDGQVNVKWLATEIVVETITVLDRKKRNGNEPEDAA